MPAMLLHCWLVDHYLQKNLMCLDLACVLLILEVWLSAPPPPPIIFAAVKCSMVGHSGISVCMK